MDKVLTDKMTFTREDTKAIKGVAIVLMILHHLWAFPNRLPVDNQLHNFGILINDTELMYAIGAFGKICLTLFMFLGGYGLWKKTRTNYSLTSDIWGLYIKLWKVAIFFIPIGLLFFSNQSDYAEDSIVCHVFEDVSLKNIVSNILGISASYNQEWWFFQAYLGVLIVGYIYIYIDRIDNFWTDVFVVVLIEIITQRIFPVIFGTDNYSALQSDMFYSLFISFQWWGCAFFMGIIFAKYDALVQLRNRYMQIVKNPLSRLVVGIVGICCIFILRQYCIGVAYDMIYAPFLIVFIIEWLSIFKPLGKIFGILGKHSTNMWLIHSFYCYYFYPVVRFVCWSLNPFVSLLILILMSFVSSVVLDRLVEMISKKSKWSLMGKK